MDGKYYPFMAVTHAITVILFLIWIPFGKFFYIIQRPAQLGYRCAGAEGPQAVCPHTGQQFRLADANERSQGGDQRIRLQLRPGKWRVAS